MKQPSRPIYYTNSKITARVKRFLSAGLSTVYYKKIDPELFFFLLSGEPPPEGDDRRDPGERGRRR